MISENGVITGVISSQINVSTVSILSGAGYVLIIILEIKSIFRMFFYSSKGPDVWQLPITDS